LKAGKIIAPTVVTFANLELLIALGWLDINDSENRKESARRSASSRAMLPSITETRQGSGEAICRPKPNPNSACRFDNCRCVCWQRWWKTTYYGKHPATNELMWTSEATNADVAEYLCSAMLRDAAKHIKGGL
jgi:hypothetical protein